MGERIIPGKWVVDREAILPEPNRWEENDYDYTPPQRLREKFKEHGLQVIVKMASIELTPEKPYFPAGSWHVSCYLLPLTLLLWRAETDGVPRLRGR